MAHFHRLIISLLLLLASNVYASIPPTYEYSPNGIPGATWHSSAYAACMASIAHRNSLHPESGYTYTFKAIFETPKGPNYSVGCTADYGNAQGMISPDTPIGIDFRTFCPSNSTSSGGACVCNSGYVEYDNSICKPSNPCPEGQVEQGGACVPKDCNPNQIRVNGVCVDEPPCPPGQTRVNGICKKNGCEVGKNVGDYEVSEQSVLYMCLGGCQARVKASICVSWEGKKTCTGSAILTGSKCSSDGEGGGGPNPGNPGDGGNPPGGDPGSGGGTGPGTGPGTGDGGTGPGSGGTGPGTGNGGTGPGTGDGGGGTGPGDSSGPGDVPGGGSGTNPGSGLGGTPKPVDEDQDGNCPPGTKRIAGKCYNDEPVGPDSNGKCPEGYTKVNSTCYPLQPPTNGGDGDGDGDGDGGFGGDCMAGFACEGDAVTCAVAKEQHRRNCRLFDDESEESKLYMENKGKQGNQTKNLDGNEDIDLNNRINSTDLFGGGQGVQDLNITVWGQSVVLPLSKVNTGLQALGNVLLAVSFLLALRIVTRG